jgi:hypothetical protein
LPGDRTSDTYFTRTPIVAHQAAMGKGSAAGYRTRNNEDGVSVMSTSFPVEVDAPHSNFDRSSLL